MSYFDNYKNRRSKDSSNSYRETTKEFLNSSFDNSPTYDPNVKINGTTIGARVIEGKDSFYKKLLFKPPAKYDIGSLVEIKGELWLMSDFVVQEFIPKAMLQYCNNSLNLGTTIEPLIVPVIISRSDLVKFDVEDNRHDVNIMQGAVYVFAQLNEISKGIGINKRFVLGSQAYQVVGIDDLTYSKNGIGLIRFSMKLVSKSEKDDFNSGTTTDEELDGSDWI